MLPDSIAAKANEFEKLFLEPTDIRSRKINLKQWTSDRVKELNTDCKIVRLDNDEISVRYRYGLQVSAESEALVALLKTIANVLVFSDPRVKTLEEKGKLVIETLFDKFCADPKLLPLDYQELIKGKKFGTKERLVADFVAGMTDRYAYAYYGRLTQPGMGSFYEFV